MLFRDKGGALSSVVRQTPEEAFYEVNVRVEKWLPRLKIEAHVYGKRVGAARVGEKEARVGSKNMS